MNERRSLRVWGGRLALIALGLGLVAGSELALRLWPGLAPPPLVEVLAHVRGKTLRSISPRYPERYFSERYQGRLVANGRMAARYFVEPSESRPYRILFVGDSTVQGFPHPKRLAAASFLEEMLRDARPGRSVEVFNLGITSIASFAVARVVEDAMELQPDLVVVYTGHNEFYGIYGADEGATPWRNRLNYVLLEGRFSRLLGRCLDAVRGHQVNPKHLLQVMAERGQVPLDSPRRPAARAQLRANLEDMSQRCRAHQVPLVLCTLVANDAGFAPAASAAPQLAGEDQSRWESWVDQAAEILGAGRPGSAEATVLPAVGQQGAAGKAESVDAGRPAADASNLALSLLEQAAPQADQSAWLWYLKGQALAGAGRGAEALAAFRRARDLDLMPWRAPSGHDEVIRQVARQNGARLAEVEAAFLRASPSEGIGWDLMADHLHPSVRGQALLARAILDALDGLPGCGPLDRSRLRTDAEYQALLGDLPVERVKVDQAMAHLLAEPPMDRYNQASARRFGQRAAAGWQALSAAEQRGAKKWNEHMEEVPVALDVADQLLAAQAFQPARDYYAAARREAPYTPRGDLWAAVQLAWITRLLGETFSPAQQEELREVAERADFLAQAPDPNRYFLDFVAGTCHHFLGESGPALARLERAFGDPETRRQSAYNLFPALAEELLQAGRLEEARLSAAKVSEETGNPYFRQLVETLAQGGTLVAPARVGNAPPRAGSETGR